MRRWFLPAGVLGALLAFGVTAVSAPPPPLRQVRFDLRVVQGDPLGSREEGTQENLGSTQLVAMENTPGRYMVGSEIAVKRGEGEKALLVPYGHSVEARAKLLQQGQAFLDITFELTAPSKKRNQRKGCAVLNTARARLLGTFLLGEVVKLSLEGRPARDQVWVEVTVTKVDKN